MVAVVPTPPPILQFLNSSGAPLVGGLLFTYLGGTTTKTNTYTDDTGNTPNPNPLVLNALGEPPNPIFIPPQTLIKFVLAPPGDTDPPSAPIWTADNISVAPTSFGTIASQNSNNVNITGGIATLASLDVTGTATLGSITSLGTINGTNINASGTLNASGNAGVAGNLSVNGSTALATLTVSSGTTLGQTTINGTLSCNTAVNISGTATIGTGIITGNLTINGNMTGNGINSFSSVNVLTNNGFTLSNQVSDGGAGAGTLTNSPTAGNPTFWLRIVINGANYVIPAWAA